ncbi:PREDICTED: gamma-crystallin B-like, partial [Cariama cristata]|uniref:gamma-crystallin B-like n=1 Tax=Cariama cristata TaxID=54380 RepID=UPI00052001C4
DHWIQPFKPSLHLFAMLTAPEAAEHAWKQDLFYEGKGFWGHCSECGGDHINVQSYVKQCNTIHMEKGSWMIYKNPNYSGHQYFLKTGNYPDLQKWFSLCNTIRSCHVILQLQGQVLELTNECPSDPGYIYLPDICSLDVLGGSWILYEMPSECTRFLNWGAANAKIVSLQRLADLH